MGMFLTKFLHLRKKHFIIILSTIFLLVAFLLSQLNLVPVSANVLPPHPPTGSEIYPEANSTNVRMMDEHVIIDISGSSDIPEGHANVTANFTMRNLGEVQEEMKVRFPMNHTPYDIRYEIRNNREYCEFSKYPSLNNFRVWVNGSKVDFEISYKKVVDKSVSPNADGDNLYITFPCWAHFDVAFPPNQDVFVTINYTVPGDLYYGSYAGKVRYTYVIVTGAGWKDTIGNADIVARLPYDADYLNVEWCKPEGCKVSGNEVSWQFENFEPSEDISISITNPSIWKRILVERQRTQWDPKDGEAWGRLGKAYFDAILSLIF